MRCRILFEDEHLLVIHKPAGMPTQSASVMQTDVVSELKTYLKTNYIGLVHRLDQPVEGLFVVGKTNLATDVLTRQLLDGTLKKSYFALAADERGGRVSADSPDVEKNDLQENNLPENTSRKSGFKDSVIFRDSVIEEMSLTDYMLKNPKTRMAEIVPGPGERIDGKGKQNKVSGKQKGNTGSRSDKTNQGKIARLHCRVLKKEEGILHCRIDISTGRFHQIRAQMSHAKMPLLGDRKYGTTTSQTLTDQRGIRQLCLCADRLSFRHPITGMTMEYEIVPAFIKLKAE